MRTPTTTWRGVTKGQQIWSKRINSPVFMYLGIRTACSMRRRALKLWNFSRLVSTNVTKGSPFTRKNHACQNTPGVVVVLRLVRPLLVTPFGHLPPDLLPPAAILEVSAAERDSATPRWRRNLAPRSTIVRRFSASHQKRVSKKCNRAPSTSCMRHTQSVVKNQVY